MYHHRWSSLRVIVRFYNCFSTQSSFHVWKRYCKTSIRIHKLGTLKRAQRNYEVSQILVSSNLQAWIIESKRENAAWVYMAEFFNLFKITQPLNPKLKIWQQMIRRTMYLEVFHVTQQRFQQTYGFSIFQLAFSVAFSDLRVEKKRKSVL